MNGNRTKIVYLYRDASNYKYWGEFYLSGYFDFADARAHLFQGEYFVPEKIGVERLTPMQLSSDDHDLHELISAEPIDDRPRPTDMQSSDFIARLRNASSKGWFA